MHFQYIQLYQGSPRPPRDRWLAVVGGRFTRPVYYSERTLIETSQRNRCVGGRLGGPGVSFRGPLPVEPVRAKGSPRGARQRPRTQGFTEGRSHTAWVAGTASPTPGGQVSGKSRVMCINRSGTATLARSTARTLGPGRSPDATQDRLLHEHFSAQQSWEFLI